MSSIPPSSSYHSSNLERAADIIGKASDDLKKEPSATYFNEVKEWRDVCLKEIEKINSAKEKK